MKPAVERAMGHSRAALGILDDAVAFAGGHHERFFEAELHRLKGKILLGRQGDAENEAEPHFERVLEIARRQDSRSLELRAAISFARHSSARGDHRVARELLEGAYGWFTEGFDTRDLQKAKALLDEL